MSLLCPRDILITSLDAAMTFEELCEEVREMCSLHQGHPLTLKWVDNEGSPWSCVRRPVNLHVFRARVPACVCARVCQLCVRARVWGG